MFPLFICKTMRLYTYVIHVGCLRLAKLPGSTYREIEHVSLSQA